MPYSRLVLLGVSVALLPGCPASSGPAVEVPPALPPWSGFGSSVSSSVDHGDGTSERIVELSGLPVSDDAAVVLGLHPSTAGVTISIPDLPEGGHVVVCESSVDGRNRVNCKDMSGASTADLDLLAPGTHQGLTIGGTWPSGVVVELMTITYQAEDDYMATLIIG